MNRSEPTRLLLPRATLARVPETHAKWTIVSGGPGTSDEHTLNVPLAAGSGDREYATAFTELVEPAVHAFAPDVVLVSAGFDAHEADPLAGMEVTSDGFREVAARCASLAPRLGVVLEGGYNLETLPGLVEAAISGFEGS